MYIKNDEFDTTDNDIFNIKLNYNHMYTLNSADNIPCDFVFNPLNKVLSNKINMVEVVINDKCNCDEKRIIIIDATQIVLDNSDLVIVIENNIYILDCYFLSLKNLKYLIIIQIFLKIKKDYVGYIKFGTVM